jgi:ketosteroid isomerase-like protein
VKLHPLAAFVAAALSLFAAARAAAPDLPSDADAKAAKFVTDFYSAYAAKDYDRMASFYAEDAIFEDPTSDAFIRGRAKLREAMNALDAVSDLHWRFHQIVREGDVIAAQATVAGKANGVAMVTRFSTIVTLKDGRIVRHVDLLDNRPFRAAFAGEASTALFGGRTDADDVAGKASGPKSTKAEVRRVAAAFLEAMNRGDPKAANALYAEDAIFEDPTFRLLERGAAAISAYADAALPQYQYVRMSPEHLIVDDSGAVIEGTAFGLRDGFQATLRFMTFLRISGGKITAHADFFDYGEYGRLTRAADLTRDTRPTSAACKDADFSRMNFWIGNWTAVAPGGTEAGADRIEAVAGGCAVQEHWDGLYLVDMKNHVARGTHWYDPARKRWRHVWIDDTGAPPLELASVASSGPGIVYAPVREPDPSKKTRMTIRPLDDGRVEQFGEISADGGKSWKETFRLFYSRKE